MVTPLMLILSSINGDFKYDHPVDIMYLSRSDRTLILAEAGRLGRMALDDTRIMMTADSMGNPVADTFQVINEQGVEVHPATAMMLTRIREAYKVFEKSTSAHSDEEVGGEDLGADAVILRLEGNPNYAYIYVYNIMRNKSMNYSAKIAKIAELYSAIRGHSMITGDGQSQNFIAARFELQQEESFWQSLLTADLMRRGFAITDPITHDDMARVKSELRKLGFYGFVNPYKMYTDFIGSRINRKADVNISDEVVLFLDKVVRSGGVTLS